jgi:hypothetical protein
MSFQKNDHKLPSIQPSNEINQEVARNDGQIIGKVDENAQVIYIKEAQNVFFQQSVTSSYQPTTSLRREPPALLPYLANRQEQEFKFSNLWDEFKQTLQQNPPCPLVCIIHGDENQSHYNFIQRIRLVSLPKILGLDPLNSQIHQYSLPWPSKLKNLDDLSNRLQKNLAEKFVGHSYASLEDINQKFYNYEYPVIIDTDLTTEDWQEQGFEILKKLLEFWQKLHSIIPNQKLIICICIQYEFKRKKIVNTPWFKWVFSFAEEYFRQFCYQRTNKKIRRQMEIYSELNQNQLDKFKPLSVIVLPELEGINKRDAKEWAKSEDAENYVGKHEIQKLITEVIKIFNNSKDDEISMDDLAHELKNLLQLFSPD